MASGKHGHIAVALAVVIAGGALAYLLLRSKHAAPVVGVVRATEIRVAPEVGGQLASIKVRKGDHVHAGEVVAELSAIELNAAVGQARAALGAATADRNNVYAGVRAEQISALAAEVSKAKSKLEFTESQRVRAEKLASTNAGTQQALDQAVDDVAAARAQVAQAEANLAAAKAGPTQAERAIADAQVQVAATALGVLERRLDKTTLRAPADGTVTVIVAEVGENVGVGQPVLAIEESGKQWLSFNVREDFLHGLSVGTRVDVDVQGARKATPAVVTELLSLGEFATWQAERAVGDYDRSTLRLRLDPVGDQTKFVPGMTVWVSR